MDIATYWMNARPESRIWILHQCGWRTNDGRPDRTARRACKQAWCDLSHAMQAVLLRKAREGGIAL